jgi:FkbM family methyltransferase
MWTNTFKGLARETNVSRWCQARLKSSVLFEAYLHTIRREWLRQRTDEIQFFKQLLGSVGPYASIFDVGANVGNKAEVFQNVAPRVYCVEPDVANVAFLRQRFWNKPNVTVLENAVSDRPGPLTLCRFQGKSSLNTVSRKWVDILADARFGAAIKPCALRQVAATTLDQLIDTHGLPVYAKIDVEGHELAVLRGLSRPIPFLSFEVNLPEFRDESLASIKHLVSLQPNTRFNYVVSARAVRLEMDQWLPAAEFARWLESTAQGVPAVVANDCSLEIFAASRE